MHVRFHLFSIIFQNQFLFLLSVHILSHIFFYKNSILFTFFYSLIPKQQQKYVVDTFHVCYNVYFKQKSLSGHFQVPLHFSFVVLLSLHSLFLHYFCVIFLLLMKYSALDYVFLSILSPVAISATFKHKFTSISDTEFTIHCQPPTQIQSVITWTELCLFLWPSGTQMEICLQSSKILLFLFAHHITSCRRENGSLYNIN